MKNSNLEYDYSKLRGKIREVIGSEDAFGKSMGWSQRTTSLKLNNKAVWSQADIIKAMEILNIDFKDVHPYFFDYKL